MNRYALTQPQRSRGTEAIFSDLTHPHSSAKSHNRLLQDLNEAKERGIKFKTYDTQNMIPSPKLENPKPNQVYSKVLQMVNYTIWSNIKGLYASKNNGRKIGHIRFKGYGWYCIYPKSETCGSRSIERSKVASKQFSAITHRHLFLRSLTNYTAAPGCSKPLTVRLI